MATDWSGYPRTSDTDTKCSQRWLHPMQYFVLFNKALLVWSDRLIIIAAEEIRILKKVTWIYTFWR